MSFSSSVDGNAGQMVKKRPFLLITGDDSVRSQGIILMKRIVSELADFEIVATKDQQSAVGSTVNFPGSTWGTEMVDGKEAYWVDGSPSDAIYFAFDYFNRKPDLVLSGVNMGPNITTDIHRSGTVSAVVTAIQSRSTPGVAFSMETKPEMWHFVHDGSFDESLLEYPGRMLKKIIQSALDYNFPDHSFWNVNFPLKPTEKLAITNASQIRYWLNHVSVTENKFRYRDEREAEREPGSDVLALDNGVISITPCKLEFTDYSQVAKLQRVFYD